VTDNPSWPNLDTLPFKPSDPPGVTVINKTRYKTKNKPNH